MKKQSVKFQFVTDANKSIDYLGGADPFDALEIGCHNLDLSDRGRIENKIRLHVIVNNVLVHVCEKSWHLTKAVEPNIELAEKALKLKSYAYGYAYLDDFFKDAECGRSDFEVKDIELIFEHGLV